MGHRAHAEERHWTEAAPFEDGFADRVALIATMTLYVPTIPNWLVPADRLGGRPQRLIGHRRIAPHHRLALPAAERHDDGRCETGVERHRRPVMPEIMEAK